MSSGRPPRSTTRDVGEVADPVVAPRHHLEHRRVVRLAEHRQDRLGGGDDVVDRGRRGSAGSAVAASRSSSARTSSWPRARAASISGSSKLRNRTRRARSPTTGWRTWVAVIRCSSVRRYSSRICGRQRGEPGRVREPPLQQVQHHRHVRAGPAVGEEHPVERAGERLVVGGAQVAHAVVGERGAQPGAERLGQALGVGVARAQEGVQVLLRVVRPLGACRPPGPRRARASSTSGPRRLRDSADRSAKICMIASSPASTSGSSSGRAARAADSARGSSRAAASSTS